MKSTCCLISVCILLFNCFVFQSCVKHEFYERPDEMPLDTGSTGLRPIQLLEETGLRPINTQIIARVTGPTPFGETLPNPNNTQANYGLNETDIGVMWETNAHEIMMVFGDNFDIGRGDSWKSNCLAFSSDRDLRNGMSFSSMLMNGGQLEELLDPSPDDDTNIPLGGVAVGDRNYIFYKAVDEWEEVGPQDHDMWTVRYGELAYSDDYGWNWKRSGVQWNGNGHFAQAFLLKKGRDVYFFGTPGGRRGDLYLAKVDQDSMLTPSSYHYWNGIGWNNNNESEAKPIVLGPVSAEMSVIYNTRYDRFFMMYLSVERRAIVFRDAKDITGEWSQEHVVMEDNGNAVYAPYFHPWFAGSDDLYYCVSYAHENVVTEKWNVFLYHSRLDSSLAFNLLSEPGFEELPGLALGDSTKWTVTNSVADADTHTGNVSCKLTNTASGVFKDAAVQTVAVKPGKTYKLSAWVKSSQAGITDTYLGARTVGGGAVLHDEHPTIGTGWSKISTTFDSGTNTQVEIFCGAWGHSGLSIWVDDFLLSP
ncbi:MAG: DUF4185 domain-containing protein [Ferruginibacter sp.]